MDKLRRSDEESIANIQVQGFGRYLLAPEKTYIRAGSVPSCETTTAFCTGQYPTKTMKGANGQVQFFRDGTRSDAQ